MSSYFHSVQVLAASAITNTGPSECHCYLSRILQHLPRLHIQISFLTYLPSPRLSATLVGNLGCYPTPETPPQPAGATVIGINYGASSVSASAQTAALATYYSLVARAAVSSTPIAPVMDSTRRFPGVYTCIPYCNLGGGVLTLDAQGVSGEGVCVIMLCDAAFALNS